VTQGVGLLLFALAESYPLLLASYLLWARHLLPLRHR